MTSAPSHASSCVQVGPDCTWVKSRMRMPSSALPAWPQGLALGRGKPLAAPAFTAAFLAFSFTRLAILTSSRSSQSGCRSPSRMRQLHRRADAFEGVLLEGDNDVPAIPIGSRPMPLVSGIALLQFLDQVGIGDLLDRVIFQPTPRQPVAGQGFIVRPAERERRYASKPGLDVTTARRHRGWKAQHRKPLAAFQLRARDGVERWSTLDLPHRRRSGCLQSRHDFLRTALCGLSLPMRPLSVPAAGSITALMRVGLPESMAALTARFSSSGVVA